MKRRFADNYNGIGFAVLACAVGIGALFLFLPFLPAILWASVLAVLMQPIYRRFRRRMGEGLASFMTVMTAIAVVALPFITVASLVGVQIHSFTEDVASNQPDGTSAFSLEFLAARADDAIKPLAERLGVTGVSVQKIVTDNKPAISKSVSSFAAKGALATGQQIFMLVVALLTLFFLLRDGARLKDPVLNLIPLPRDKSEPIVKRVNDTILAVFLSVILVGIAQGILAGITYYITGVPNAFLWMIASIVVAFIPLLGAPIVYIPIGLIHLSQGHYWQAAVVLIVGFGIVSQIDNLLKPWIIGSRVSLHPMAVFFSLLGGIILFGPIGLMAGPMLLSIALALVDIVTERLKMDQAIAEEDSAKS